jgi:hypothetical protein
MRRCSCGKLSWATEQRARRHVERLKRTGNDKKDRRTLVTYVCPRSGVWHVGHSRVIAEVLRRAEQGPPAPKTLTHLQEAIHRTMKILGPISHPPEYPVVPKRIITTWITDTGRDTYTDRHREMFQHCLNSWLKLMPDYEIVVVTLGNLFKAAAPDDWVTACIRSGRFIGASQWARLQFLNRYGGIFLDADVEAVQRFDSLLHTGYTLGHLGNGQQFANNAIMATCAEHPFLAEQFDYLTTQTDPLKDGPDFGNASGPFMVSNLLRQKGWDGADKDTEVHGITVRRSAVFHPYNWNQSYDPALHLQPDTLAVHHWASSWKARDQQPQHGWRR